MHKKHFLSLAINTENTGLRGETPSPTPSSFLCKKRKSSKQLNSYQLFNQCRQLKVFLVPSAAFGGGRNNVEEILWRSRGEAP